MPAPPARRPPAAPPRRCSHRRAVGPGGVGRWGDDQGRPVRPLRSDPAPHRVPQGPQPRPRGELQPIPTCVGLRRELRWRTSWSAVHPHARGAQRTRPEPRTWRDGPSPRAWGSGKMTCENRGRYLPATSAAKRPPLTTHPYHTRPVPDRERTPHRLRTSPSLRRTQFSPRADRLHPNRPHPHDRSSGLTRSSRFTNRPAIVQFDERSLGHRTQVPITLVPCG